MSIGEKTLHFDIGTHAVSSLFLKEPAVATLEEVDLWVKQLGVLLVVLLSIYVPQSEVLAGCSSLGVLTVEYKHCIARLWVRDEVIDQLLFGVEVNSANDVASRELLRGTTVDDLIIFRFTQN